MGRQKPNTDHIDPGLQDQGRTIEELQSERQTLLQQIAELQEAVLTERKRADEALTQYKLMRTVIDNIPVTFYAKDMQGRKTLANMADVIVSGFDSEADVLGKTDAELYPPEIAANFLIDDNLVLEKGETIFNREEVAANLGGKPTWLSSSKLPLRGPDGKLIGMMGIGIDITGRKVVEEALAHERYLLRTLIDSLPISIYAKDLQGRKTLSNLEDVRNCGGTVEADVLGKTDAEMFPAERAAKFMADDALVLEKGQSILDLEEILSKRSGGMKWQRTSKIPLLDPTGKIIGLVGTGTDITDRKNAEEALSRLAAIVESSDDAIISQTLDGIITSWNSGAERLYKYSADEIIGKSISILFPPDKKGELKLILEKIKSGERLTYFDTRHMTKEGQTIEVSLTISPIYNHSGEIIGASTIGRDISDRKRAEEEIFNSRKMLQLVLDTIPQRVFWKDRNLTYLGCNRSFAQDSGLANPAAVVGKNDLDLSVNKENAVLYRTDDMRVMESDTPKLNYEEPQERSDGSKQWLRTNKVPLHDREGNVIGVMGTYEDITDSKRAEEDIRQANEKLIIWVNELENRNREASLLRQMDDLLQVCNESGEAYAIIQQFGPQLLPTTAGALYITSNSRNVLEAMASWGQKLQSERTFAPDDCWALRRGQTHAVSTNSIGINCKHVSLPFLGSYLDVPMMASGETMGVLHIEGPEKDWFNQGVQELSRTVAEHLALSLSNLRLRETLRTQSIRDQLTGLFNRRYMEESLERELRRATRKESLVGIIMLDIDHFKHYNDTYGHDAGDIVLRELGVLLQRHVRGEDIACRYGGEEFILILPDASLEATIHRAEQIRESVESMKVEYRFKPLGVVTMSLGVAMFPQHSTSRDEILQKADDALYAAKRNGRNRVEVAV